MKFFCKQTKCQNNKNSIEFGKCIDNEQNRTALRWMENLMKHYNYRNMDLKQYKQKDTKTDTKNGKNRERSINERKK